MTATKRSEAVASTPHFGNQCKLLCVHTVCTYIKVTPREPVNQSKTLPIYILPSVGNSAPCPRDQKHTLATGPVTSNLATLLLQ